MSRRATASLPWGDGKPHSFRLGLAELEELDALCGVGPGYLLGLCAQGQRGNWKARQLRETLRLGLIGAGATPVAAAVLVEAHFDRFNGEAVLAWGDTQSQRFKLDLAALDVLDKTCAVGPGFLLGHCLDGQYGNWRAGHLRAVLKLGLIGAGKTDEEAARLMNAYFDRTPLAENITAVTVILGAVVVALGDHIGTVLEILSACVLGVEDDAPGESLGEAETTIPANPSPTDDSASPTSSEAAPPSVSLLEKFGPALFGNSKRRSSAGAKPTRPPTKTPSPLKNAPTS